MTSTEASLHEGHVHRVPDGPVPGGPDLERSVPDPGLPPMLVAALRVDRRVWLGGGAVAGVGALLAVGVPPATLLSLGALGACAGMHLFMGHGSHGGHGGHAGHGQPSTDDRTPTAPEASRPERGDGAR